MKSSWYFPLIILSIALCKGQNYSDEQIIVMIKQYFKNSSTDTLLGNHFFINENKNIFQIEIQIVATNFNNSLIKSFSAITRLSEIAKSDFSEAIIIFHFKNNNVPIIAKSDLKCSKKFFIEKTNNEIQWRKNCLSIQNL